MKCIYNRLILFLVISICILLTSCPAYIPPDNNDGPGDLPVGGVALWLRADQGVNKDESNYVYTWEDGSGLGNHAIAGSKPLWVESEINGKPAIRFTGTEYFVLPDFLSFNDLTIFIVYKAAASEQILFFDFGSDEDENIGIRINEYNGTDFFENFYIRDSAGHFFDDDSGSVTGTHNIEVYHILTTRLAGDTAELYYNGSRDSYCIESTYDTTTTWEGSSFDFLPSIGRHPTGSGYLDGGIAEIIFYDSALSASSMGKVEDYLESRYGL